MTRVLCLPSLEHQLGIILSGYGQSNEILLILTCLLVVGDVVDRVGDAAVLSDGGIIIIWCAILLTHQR